MKLLLANPNMSADMTERLTATARSAVSADVEILPATAARGFPYISSRAEAQVAGGIALEMIAARIGEIDAAIVAAFGDPGLKAARELFDIPVVGLAEAAIMAANMLGERFAIVTFSVRMTSWYVEQVEASGLGGRFVGCLTPEPAEVDVATVARDLSATLAELARTAAREAGADVVILGGAPIAGVAARLQPEVPAILVDPVAAAAAMAEAMVRIAPSGASRGRFARPPGKPSVGLDPTLAGWIAGPAARRAAGE